MGKLFFSLDIFLPSASYDNDPSVIGMDIVDVRRTYDEAPSSATRTNARQVHHFPMQGGLFTCLDQILREKQIQKSS